MRLSQLIDRLDRLDWKHAVLRGTGGGSVVVCERGGRILGAFASERGDNLLWVCPDLADEELAPNKYGRDSHWNSGGERVWLSPETEFHIRDLDAWADTYIVQGTIDPGRYRLEQGSVREVSWQQDSTADAFRHRAKVAFRLKKSCALIEDPLAVSGTQAGLGDYFFIGYETNAELATSPGEIDVPASLWTLMQLPAGGEMIVPTYGRVEPEQLFGRTADSHLTVREGEIRFRVDAKKSLKISIKGINATGRIGYIRHEDDGYSTLIVRQISIDPTRVYGDVPIRDLNDFGYCVQCYNDDGTIGNFGELEYHTPMIRGSKDEALLKDRSQAWCYTGPRETIVRLSGILLGTRE